MSLGAKKFKKQLHKKKKIKIWMYNERNSLDSEHEITLTGWFVVKIRQSNVNTNNLLLYI